MSSKLECRCPYGVLQAGPPIGGPSVICRAMEAEGERTDAIAEGETSGKLLTLAENPSTVLGMCCGTDLPLLGPRSPIEKGRRTHTVCPVFREEWERQQAHRRRLLERVEADPNAIYPFHTPPKSGAGVRSAEDSLVRADDERTVAETARDIAEMVDDEAA